MKRNMIIVVLFVLAAIVSTSSASFDPQEKSVIAADSQAQVQDMKCGEEGCGKKAECDKDKKCCGTDGSCCKKAECSKEKKAECDKDKKCCGTDGACCK
ncbi:MAG: hypothetical protein ACYSO7_00050 [Planctomycetota bacterium]|jgi:hypothetical protein